MKSRLQRSATALLVAMVGMSLVFGAGCASSKKKKAKEETELPDKKDEKKETASNDDKPSDTGSGTSDIGGGSKDKFDAPPTDSLASNPPPKDDLTPAPAPGGGSFEGLESRHGSATIGQDDQNLALAPAAAPEGDAAAPEAKPKKKKGKKKKGKKAPAAPIETADADAGAAAGDDAGGADGANSYTVKKGDSLSKIAKSHGVKLKALLTANGMKMEDAAKLKVGAKIKIPGSKAG
jgi:LysM repeat protein